MTLFVLTAMIFLVTLGLTISGAYLFVEAPAARKRRSARLATVQQTLMHPSAEAEVQILRDEVLSEIPALNRVLSLLPFISRLQMFLQQAAMQITVGTLLLMSLSFALFFFLVALVANLSTPITALCMGGAAGIPFVVIAIKRERRLSRFGESFPDAIDLLARAVRAGHAFTTGFELIAREMSEPLAGEFQITYDQQNLGLPLREALANLSVRVPLPDVLYFVSALQIQRESGGNLAEILDKLSYVIRERFKILRQVKVYTAEGRLSLYILTALPPFTAVAMFIVNREYIMTLFTDPLGEKFLVAAVVLQVVGFFVLRHITRLKV
jgi:tight adherence protein B